tara:strand:- start:3 stop:293 length:291 start_codon:yes stop_codon:yes gene_type:complete
MSLDLKSDEDLKSKQVGFSDLVSRSRSIGRGLYDRRHQAAQKRSLPQETINDLLDTKILRALSWDINVSLWGRHMFSFNENENEIDRQKSYFVKGS